MIAPIIQQDIALICFSFGSYLTPVFLNKQFAWRRQCTEIIEYDAVMGIAVQTTVVLINMDFVVIAAMVVSVIGMTASLSIRMTNKEQWIPSCVDMEHPVQIPSVIISIHMERNSFLQELVTPKVTRRQENIVCMVVCAPTNIVNIAMVDSMCDDSGVVIKGVNEKSNYDKRPTKSDLKLCESGASCRNEGCSFAHHKRRKVCSDA